MTSTYAHSRTVFHAHSNQMPTKSLTDLWTRYDAAGTSRAKPQVSQRMAQGCGRKMHTGGPQHHPKIFKFIAKSLMNTLFEQLS